MTNLVIASSEADAHAVEAVTAHHAEMLGTLRAHTETLLAAVASGDLVKAQHARVALADWCTTELMPHAVAEESTLYPPARRTLEGRLLIEAMLGEHAAIVSLVGELAGAPDPVRAAAAGRALRAVLEVHVDKENEKVLPLLTSLPDVSVAQLLQGMHEVLGAAEVDPTSAEGTAGEHACSCGHSDEPGYPELDARSIPHAIRHATIFGALQAVAPDDGLVLVAPHDPLPLLAQVGERWPGVFAVEYLERGPEAWRLSFVRH